MEVLKNFIVIEGIDGCGKGTQVSLLKDFLAEKGLDVWHTTEPTDGEYGRRIRAILRGELPHPGALELQTLYVKDREHHVKEIREQLQKGKLVLCDRYLYSTLAYGTAEDVPFTKLMELNRGFPRPRVMIWLAIGPERAMERLQQARQLEWFERLQTLQKVHQGYARMAEDKVNFPEIRQVDADGTEEEVQQRIRAVLEGIFAAK